MGTSILDTIPNWKLEVGGTEAVLSNYFMTKTANAQVSLTNEALRTIYKDIAQRPHIEACGVLLGTLDELNNWHVEQVHPLRNTFSSPVYFEFDPEELLTVELTHPEQIVGVYHSHPTGFAKASHTDRENMQRVNQQQHIPWVWLIICGPFNEDFEQQCLEKSIATSMIAYHHYEREGLCKIRIQLEQAQIER